MHTLALPIKNALLHVLMHVVQVQLFTSYYLVQEFLRDHMGGWVERSKEGCSPNEISRAYQTIYKCILLRREIL